MCFETFEVEYTDIFGGEANYSWVIRHTIRVPADASLAAVLHAAISAVGCRNVGETSDYGDVMAFYPDNCSTVLFVTYAGDDGSGRCENKNA